MPQQNWAGNYTYSPAEIHFPESLDELRALVSRSRKIRALGSRHSFNGIADSENLVSLTKLPRLFELDREAKTVTIDGGSTFGDICGRLHEAGFALPNMASLPHVSVAGACATATHGSGDANGCLATAVSSMELVTADGELVTLSRGEKDFDGAVVGLGTLGVVSRLTLDLLPTFELTQCVFLDLPLSQVEDNFDAVTGCGYSVSLFTDWHESRFTQVWVKGPIGPTSLMSPAERPMHPIAPLSADPCTEQMCVAGPWHERLPHFRMLFTPSAGEELQSEYMVPRRHALPALRAMFGLGEEIGPLLQISEVRTVAADHFWMSPFYQEDSVAIHFTWVKDWPAVRALLPRIEEALAPLEARPHWGKLFMMGPERLHQLYSRLPDFRDLMMAHDSAGKFRNEFVEQILPPIASA